MGRWVPGSVSCSVTSSADFTVVLGRRGSIYMQACIGKDFVAVSHCAPLTCMYVVALMLTAIHVCYAEQGSQA